MARTLLLDTQLWDLVKDASGHIAVASEPYSLAQMAACKIKQFRGEYWYDITQGVPYFQKILGKNASLNAIKLQLQRAAETVQGVASATVIISALDQRQLTGQVQVTATDGTTTTASF